MQSTVEETHRGPVRHGVPPARSRPLVGRDALLSTLKARLRDFEDVALCSGLPGAGKTAVAHALAWDPDVALNFDDFILWTSLGPEPAVEFQLASWAKWLGVTEAELHGLDALGLGQAVTDAIGDKAVLICIDDAWTPEDAMAFRLGGPRTAHVLTTRLRDVALEFADSHETDLKELQPEDALELFRSLAPDVFERDPERVKKCRECLELAAGLPLTVILVAHYLQDVADAPDDELDAAIDTVLQHRDWRLDQKLSAQEFRLRCLRDAIKLSYDKLDADAQATLSSLTVFPPKTNTFSREAADAVAETPSAISHLRRSGLVELIVLKPERYTLHQAIADYAAETRKDETAYGRMAEHFISYIAEEKEHNASKAAWLQSLVLEQRNLGEALDWTWRSGQATLGLKLASALFDYWYERSRFEDGRRWIDRLLKLDACGDPLLVAKALNDSGNFSYSQGDLEDALSRYKRSLERRDDAGDEQAISGSLNNIGLVYRDRGRYRDAETKFREALAINVKLGNADWRGRNLNNIGRLQTQRGDGRGGQKLQLESLECFADAGSQWGTAMALGDLGFALRALGRRAEAQVELAKSLRVRAEIEDVKGTAVALHGLGALAVDRGDPQEAEQRLTAALQLCMDIGDREGIALCLQSLARVAHARRQWADAATHLMAAAAYRHSNGSVNPPVSRPVLKAVGTDARHALGEQEYRSVREACQVTTLTQLARDIVARQPPDVDQVMNAAAAAEAAS